MKWTVKARVVEGDGEGVTDGVILGLGLQLASTSNIKNSGSHMVFSLFISEPQIR